MNSTMPPDTSISMVTTTVTKVMNVNILMSIRVLGKFDAAAVADPQVTYPATSNPLSLILTEPI